MVGREREGHLLRCERRVRMQICGGWWRCGSELALRLGTSI